MNAFGSMLLAVAVEHVSKLQVQQASEVEWYGNQLRCPFTRGSGEPPIGVWLVAASHTRLVLQSEDLADEFSAAAHADLVEDGLEVISHRVGRDVEFLRHFGRGQPAQD